MKKTFAVLIALSALSTGALAAGDDHGGNGKLNPAFDSQDNSDVNAFEVAPVVRDDDSKPHYLNWNQLR